jgi:mono/diheme cytochrome c family protein
MKLRFFIPVLAAFLLSATLVLPAGCFYDNEEELYGPIDPGSCDTTAQSYQNDILPILEANCYSCHTEQNNISGNPFDTYAKLKNYVNAGRVHARINDASNPMPPTGLLPECDRAKIDAWINAGAANN